MQKGILQQQENTKFKIGDRVGIVTSPYLGITFKPFYDVKELSGTKLCMLECEQYGKKQLLAFYDSELTPVGI